MNTRLNPRWLHAFDEDDKDYARSLKEEWKQAVLDDDTDLGFDAWLDARVTELTPENDDDTQYLR